MILNKGLAPSSRIRQAVITIDKSGDSSNPKLMIDCKYAGIYILNVESIVSEAIATNNFVWSLGEDDDSGHNNIVADVTIAPAGAGLASNTLLKQTIAKGKRVYVKHTNAADTGELMVIVTYEVFDKDVSNNGRPLGSS